MKWVNSDTALMKDTTIIIFKKSGRTEVYPSLKWRYRIPIKTELGFYHLFQFKNKKAAKQVFINLDKKLKK